MNSKRKLDNYTEKTQPPRWGVQYPDPERERLRLPSDPPIVQPPPPKLSPPPGWPNELEIYQSNSQWACTNYGIECVVLPFFITKERLGAQLHITTLHWPIHMLRQLWVDPAAFEETFRAAVIQHRDEQFCRFDDEILERSFEVAHQRRRQARTV